MLAIIENVEVDFFSMVVFLQCLDFLPDLASRLCGPKL
jgi:hypothetical protein